ncbi:MAG: hypothetical protein QXT10_00290 [Candidatus Bathyarchaeia archaeon]
MVGLKSKLKVEDRGFLAASAFHIIVGVLCLAILVTVDLGLIHVGLIGVISLATGYGLFRRRVWAVWSMFVAAFMATVFALSTIYYTMGSDVLLDAAMIIYTLLTWIFTIYVASKRDRLAF